MHAPCDPFPMLKPTAGDALMPADPDRGLAGRRRALAAWATVLVMIVTLVVALTLARPMIPGHGPEDRFSDSVLPASSALAERPKPGMPLGDDAILPEHRVTHARAGATDAAPRPGAVDHPPVAHPCPRCRPRAPPVPPTMTI